MREPKSPPHRKCGVSGYLVLSRCCYVARKPRPVGHPSKAGSIPHPCRPPLSHYDRAWVRERTPRPVGHSLERAEYSPCVSGRTSWHFERARRVASEHPVLSATPLKRGIFAMLWPPLSRWEKAWVRERTPRQIPLPEGVASLSTLVLSRCCHGTPHPVGHPSKEGNIPPPRKRGASEYFGAFTVLPWNTPSCRLKRGIFAMLWPPLSR